MLIIKCLMLTIKHFTLLSQKIEKKAGIFNKVAKKSSSARFVSHLVARFRFKLTKILFYIECTKSEGASPNINWVMAILFPQPL